MTVDEALALTEVVLDGKCLNNVEEFIFRQCWEGRCSYQEIAELSKYDNEYIRAIAAKLWKQLSAAFDQKVKKNNLQSVFKQYLRRNQINLHRTQEIEVNLRGANLTGATLNFASLSGTKLLLANFSEPISCQQDMDQASSPNKSTDSPEEIIYGQERNSQQTHSSLEETMRESVIYQEIHQDGFLEGQQREAISFVTRLVTRRLGAIAPEIQGQIQTLSVKELENLGEALLDFSEAEDLANWLREHQS